MRLMVTMCKYISVLYVDINKFAIVVVHNDKKGVVME